MKMLVGFTGTQIGMTSPQFQTCYKVLLALYEKANGLDEFHHGDCVGADKEANGIVALRGWVQVHIHPPENAAKRAFCKPPCVYIYKPKPYLERNRDIVDACPVLVAAPQGTEVTRSGTWATVRYARKLKRFIITVWPSGDFSEEG